MAIDITIKFRDLGIEKGIPGFQLGIRDLRYYPGIQSRSKKTLGSRDREPRHLVLLKIIIHLSVGRFGRITSEPLVFEELTGNTFFYEPQLLGCESYGSPVVWRYSQNSDLSDGSILTETFNYVDFSWLNVHNTKQGYYQCMISSSISYTVGVYDRTLTTGLYSVTISSKIQSI